MAARHPDIDPLRRRLLLSSLGAAGVMLAGRVCGADLAGRDRPLEFGVVPYLPTARLLTIFEPLRAHFAASFQRPIALSTAPDFKSFQRRALDGEYDLYFIGPGPGWQVHRDRHHLVLVVAKAILRIYLVVAQGGTIRQLTDLRGKMVATIDPLTVTAQVTAALLQGNGLEPGRDVMLRTEKTPFNAVQAVALGEVAAAACPDVAWPDLPDELRSRLQIIYRSEGLPGGMLMMRPAADLPTPEAIRKAIFDFDASTAGRIFAKESGQLGFDLPDMQQLAVLERFLPETRRVMSQP
ncbi:phosphate/phosphite/phosphonate ABC transporter substrate-binding protein [Sulfuricystis multivorans]|uniref:phosphate/phosphite/phosphonate ABC transporter substrate-binding protein n=1 Tax=Sulfuricystis multivorans TaxID=2211108 RepID=UPI000F81B442|nr:PhnD/SsuA/transferrin family substrate-binding protein [Sulfuricystis multivorans]